MEDLIKSYYSRVRNELLEAEVLTLEEGGQEDLVAFLWEQSLPYNISSLISALNAEGVPPSEIEGDEVPEAEFGLVAPLPLYDACLQAEEELSYLSWGMVLNYIQAEVRKQKNELAQR